MKADVGEGDLAAHGRKVLAVRRPQRDGGVCGAEGVENCLLDDRRCTPNVRLEGRGRYCVRCNDRQRRRSDAAQMEAHDNESPVHPPTRA